MNYIPANIKDEREAKIRMIDGEVFYHGDYRYEFYDNSFVGSLTMDHNILIPWSTCTEWLMEAPKRTWEDDVKDGEVVVCVVSDDGAVYVDYINSISSVGRRHKGRGSNWEFARPLRPSECWKGDELIELLKAVLDLPIDSLQTKQTYDALAQLLRDIGEIE